MLPVKMTGRFLETLQAKFAWVKGAYISLKNLIDNTFPKMTENIFNFDHHFLPIEYAQVFVNIESVDKVKYVSIKAVYY